MREVETLGVAQVRIRSALLKSSRGGWAYIRVPVVARRGVKSNSFEIADNRSAVVEAAEQVFNISAEINLVKRKRSTADQTDLQAQLSEALKTFQEVFQSPALVTVQEQVTVGGGESYQRIVLNDADEDESDAILDVIRTYGLWMRNPRSNFLPIYGDRERRKALHIVYANGEGVTIWDLRESKVHLFQIAFPEGRSIRTYKEVVAEPEEEEEEMGLAESHVELPPVEEPPEDPTAAALADEPTNPFAGSGLTSGEIEQLKSEGGILTAQELIDFAKDDADTLAKDTGIDKKRLKTAARKLKKLQNNH